MTNRGRKKRKSAIITDTPEKDAIEQEKRGKTVPKQKQKRCTNTRSRIPDSSSESDIEPIVSDHSSDHVIDDEPSDVEEPISKSMLMVGMFLLVEYATKKSFCYYVAQLEGISDDELVIDCLKRVSNTNRFRKPDQKDPDVISVDRVQKILTPTCEGLSGRAIGGFTFSIDSRLDVR